MSSAGAGFRPAVFTEMGGASTEAGKESSASRVQGYAAGYAAGLRAAEEQSRALRQQLSEAHDRAQRERQRTLDAAVSSLAAAADALNRRTAPVIEEARGTLADTALELAEAVLAMELLDTAHGARAALARALDGIDTRSVHSVRMNAEDIAALPPGAAETSGVRVVADPALLRGDAMTEFEDGFLDARIREALARCRSVLQGAGQ